LQVVQLVDNLTAAAAALALVDIDARCQVSHLAAVVVRKHL
jgi:hypothetical protein